MPRPRVTFSRNGTTSSGPSGPPNDTSSRASYGRTSAGGMVTIVERRPLLSASMLTTYRRILAVPGARLFSATGLVGRLPISMQGLGIVLLVVDVTGSYGYAGSVAGAATIANAVASILQGRALDRLGQRRVLPALIVTWGAALALLIASVHGEWPRWTVFALAVVAGLMLPPVGTCVRARWSHVLDEPRQVQTAYALESVVDEAVFIAGPILVTVLATAWDPVAGLAAAVIAGVGGTLFLASQRATEPPGHPHVSTADERAADAVAHRGARSRSSRWRWGRCSARPR